MDGNIFRKIKAGASLLLFTFFLTTSSFQCNRNDDWEESVGIRLVLPLQFQPARENFKTGDTLWITADIDDDILEFNSQQQVRLQNFDFLTRIGIFQLIGNHLWLSDQPGAMHVFAFINERGKITEPRDTFADFKFDYENDRYICRIGVVPSAPGVFCINFLAPSALRLPDLNLGVSPEGKPFRPYYTHTFYIINDGLHNNVELMRANCKLSSDTRPQTSLIFYEQKGSFTFRVLPG